MILKIGIYDANLLKVLQNITTELKVELVKLEKKFDDSIGLVIAPDKYICELYNSLADGKRPTLFVTVDEDAQSIPEAFMNNWCDDMLALPLRSFDFIRALRWHYHLENLRDLEASSKALPELVHKLQEDVKLAQKVQRRLIKDKFPSIQGLNVKSKYWCGLQPGGDYFDIFEFPDHNHVGFLLSDSSSYSLSTTFLGSLMQLSNHVSQEEIENPASVVAKLYEQIKTNLKPKDQFSILYGVLNRKTYEFRYVVHGNIWLLHRGASNKWLSNGEGEPSLSREQGVTGKCQEVPLEPDDRLIFFSDGWKDGIKNSFEDMAEKASRVEAQELLNEFAFKLRKEISVDDSDDFPMPPQDCSMIVVDIAKNVLRLAR